MNKKLILSICSVATILLASCSSKTITRAEARGILNEVIAHNTTAFEMPEKYRIETSVEMLNASYEAISECDFKEQYHYTYEEMDTGYEKIWSYTSNGKLIKAKEIKDVTGTKRKYTEKDDPSYNEWNTIAESLKEYIKSENSERLSSFETNFIPEDGKALEPGEKEEYTTSGSKGNLTVFRYTLTAAEKKNNEFLFSISDYKLKEFKIIVPATTTKEVYKYDTCKIEKPDISLFEKVDVL